VNWAKVFCALVLQTMKALAYIAHAGMLPLSKVLSFVMRGTASLNKVWPFGVSQFVHRALRKVSIAPSVLRQPAHQSALRLGASPSLNLAVRPAAASSSVWWIERLRFVWHSQCQFAFWRFAKSIESRGSSLRSREFSLQGFSMKTVPSGKAHGPNWLVKLTQKLRFCSLHASHSGAAYLGR
jgi:hypothetical protein